MSKRKNKKNKSKKNTPAPQASTHHPPHMPAPTPHASTTHPTCQHPPHMPAPPTPQASLHASEASTSVPLPPTDPNQQLWGMVKDLQLQQQEQQQQQARKNAVLVMPRVRNAAACILKLAVSADVFSKPSKCHHVGRSGVAGDTLGQLTGLKTEDMDRVISQRNKDAHPSTQGKLDKEVSELIIFLPDLPDSCSQECTVLKKYEDIKTAFPTVFK